MVPENGVAASPYVGGSHMEPRDLSNVGSIAGTYNTCRGMRRAYSMTARVLPNRTKTRAPITPTAAVDMNAAV
jgi:hypothetical protein